MVTSMRWTAQMEQEIRTSRSKGMGWPTIGRRYGLSGEAVRKHMVQVADKQRRTATKSAPQAPLPASKDRDGNHVLPPGHAVTWGAITDGTLLAGREFGP